MRGGDCRTAAAPARPQDDPGLYILPPADSLRRADRTNLVPVALERVEKKISASFLKAFRSINHELRSFLPFGSLLEFFDLIKIDAIHQDSGRMQTSQTVLDMLVDNSVILG